MASEIFEKSIKPEFRLALLFVNTAKEPEKAMERIIDAIKDKKKISLGTEKRVNLIDEEFALPARKRTKEKDKLTRRTYTEGQYSERVEERAPLEPEEEQLGNNDSNSDEKKTIALSEPGNRR